MDHFLVDLPARAAHEDLVRTKFAPRLPGDEDRVEPSWISGEVRMDVYEREPRAFQLSLRGRARSGASRPLAVKASGALALCTADGPARGPRPPPEPRWFGSHPGAAHTWAADL